MSYQCQQLPPHHAHTRSSKSYSSSSSTVVLVYFLELLHAQQYQARHRTINTYIYGIPASTLQHTQDNTHAPIQPAGTLFRDDFQEKNRGRAQTTKKMEGLGRSRRNPSSNACVCVSSTCIDIIASIGVVVFSCRREYQSSAPISV